MSLDFKEIDNIDFEDQLIEYLPMNEAYHITKQKPIKQIMNEAYHKRSKSEIALYYRSLTKEQKARLKQRSKKSRVHN